MPLPPIDGSTPQPLDDGASVSNGSQKEGSQKKGAQKSKRKRTRSGHQAEPAASASNILQHQQTFESSHIPPIKLRRVDEGLWRVVSSFAVQSTQDPLETESVITADEEPQPMAVIEPESETPPPASDSMTPVTGEIEDEDSEDASEIPPEILSVFSPKHQAVLKNHYNDSNPDTAQAVRSVVQSAKKLLKTLRRRKIGLSYNRSNPPFPTLFAKLETLSVIKQAELLSAFFAKATVFFSAVNTDQIKNTGCLSSMLRWPRHIERFANKNDHEIQAVAGHRFLKQISSMRNNRGFPTIGEVDDFMNIACLKKGWQPGNDEAVQDNPIDRELLVHISSMNNGKGFPTEEQVKAFITMPCLREGWQPGNDEEVQNNPINRRLLRHVASMNNSRRFPSEPQVKAFITISCLKMDWQPGLDEAVKDKPIDWELVAHIASMNSGRGFPAKEQLEAFMNMPCLKEGWEPGQDEAVRGKPINRELLIRISSMNSGKGFPTKEQVEAFLSMLCLREGWQPGNDEAVKDSPIDWGLVKNIASMNNGKGFPKEAKVKAFISMICLREGWRPDRDRAVKDNPVDRKLLMHITTMHCGRDFPTLEQVKAFITIPCLKEDWKPGLDEAVKDNPIDWELIKNIASMHNGRGFPTGPEVKAFVSMPCLKVGWQSGNDEAVKGNPIDRMLLRLIASMHNGKGFPTESELKTFMTMPCLKVGWQPGCDEAVKDSPINQKLFMHIASMNNGKRFPNKEQVESFLNMPCLKKGWQEGRDEAVKDNLIDWELVMHIASINISRGFPKEWQVKAFITMPCLKVGWQPGCDEAVKDSPIDRKLFSHIIYMNHRLGFPTREQVKAFITMPCLKEGWQPGHDAAVKDKPVQRELLGHVAAMYYGKGFPVEADVIAFVQWLPRGDKKLFLKMASRVLCKSGLPRHRELAANEKIFRLRLPDLPELSGDIDYDIDDSDDEQEEDDAMNSLPLFSSAPEKWRITIAQTMKVLALFCSAPNKWHMTMAEFEQYLTAFTNAHNERTQVLSALRSLIPTLYNHGGAGVRFWLKRKNEKPQDQDLLTKALSLSAPLETIKLALTKLPESECLEYIRVCKNLSPAPNKEQWEALKPLRERLGQRYPLKRSKAMMLELIWLQPEAKRSDFAQKLDSFFDTVPGTHQLYRIHQTFKPQKMQDFLEACIARQTSNALQVKEQELILEGLLLAHHYLTDHQQIPNLCFSSQMVGTGGKGVIIKGDAVMEGQKRLWLFIAAMLIELEQVPEYKFEKQQLTILSGSGTMTLPKPEFSLIGNGFMIKNWSLEQLNAFFEATDFTERWYKHPQDERELYLVRRDERLAGSRARVNETGQDGNQKLLPPGVILSLINSGKSLKPTVWSSLEHYANNGQLTARLCRAMAPVIQSQAATVPDAVKQAVTAMLAEADAVTPTLIQPSPVINELTFEAAMDALNRFEVLEETELEMLELYRPQMTPMQLATVLKKMSDRVDLLTQLEWHKACESKKQDLPGLNEWLLEDDPFDV